MMKRLDEDGKALSEAMRLFALIRNNEDDDRIRDWNCYCDANGISLDQKRAMIEVGPGLAGTACAIS